jgi:hypothetical protein
MVIQYLIVKNNGAIQKALDMGLPPPVEILERKPVVFDINTITTAKVTSDLYLEIITPDDMFQTDYTEELWNKIVDNITTREQNI